jgi:GTP-binding protein
MLASRGDQLPDSYKRYLINGIREAFELGSAPIRLLVRQNKNPYAEEQD